MLKKGNILQILHPAGFEPMSNSHRQESGRVHSNQGPPAFIFRTGNYENIYWRRKEKIHCQTSSNSYVPTATVYLMKYFFMMFFVGILTYNKTNSFYPLQTTTGSSSANTSNRVLTTISEQTQVLSPSNLLAMQKQSTLSISQPRLNYAMSASTQLGASPESSVDNLGGGGISHVLGSTMAAPSSSSKALVPTPNVSVGSASKHPCISNLNS